MQIEEYKWKNRLLLVFTPAADHPPYWHQIELIRKERQGMEERHLLAIYLVGIGGAEVENQQLREQFEVMPQEFAVILVGKDGQEKYRSQKPVRMEEIFRIIDQMPMRQQEMRKQE